MKAGGRLPARWGLLLMLAAFAGAVRAEGESALTNFEIAHLMRFIRASSCDFYRNGSWYPSTEAHDHIQRKLDYIRARSTIPNAEYFIQEAATKSSMSGDVYQVRCPGTAVNECKGWLLNELQRLRVKPAR